LKSPEGKQKRKKENFTAVREKDSRRQLAMTVIRQAA